MNLVRCRCCHAVFNPADDPSPDLLIVDDRGVAQVAMIETDMCYSCREGGPITHLLAHEDE